jgi:two-component system sensor histidine kinase KdpD
VENLLNISRLESGHIKPNCDWCDIVELVYDVVKRVEENNERRKINISVNQNLPLCRTDKGMLDQIIYNLLNNAVIHTEPTSRIAITVTIHTDLLQFTIEDNGKGFTNIQLKDLFSKFSRHRDPKTGGSGLGLSIVKGFTEALEGTAEINSSFKEGAQFIISIPVETSYYKVYD